MENDLIEACLNNWLGYGNINSPIWFLGIEEGGAEIIEPNKLAFGKLTRIESLLIRSNFKLSEDFYEVWSQKYGLDLNELLKKPTTWKFMAAFLLAFNGEPIEKHAIKKLITESKSFGTKTGNHFLCEFYPLPKKGLGCWPVEYEPLYPNESKYYEIIAPKRLSLFLDQIANSEKLRLIICYNKAILNVPGLKDIIEDPIETFIGSEKYVLYNLKAKNKNVKLLITPFFGNGRISYNGIAKVVEELSLNAIFLN